MVKTIVLYTLTFLVSELFIVLKRERKVAFFRNYFFVVLILSVLCGFRGLIVGTDTIGYSQIYEGTTNYVIEPGLTALNAILKLFSSSVHFAFFTISLIINTLILYSLWLYRDYCPLRFSFPVFYFLIYFSTFSGIRQWLAIAFVFYATTFLFVRKNIVLYVFLSVIAILFHYSAIFAFAYLLIYNFTVKMSVGRRLLLIILVSIVATVLFVFSSYFLTRYFKYFDSIRGGIQVTLIVPARLLLLILCFFAFKKEKKRTMRANLQIPLWLEHGKMLVVCQIIELALYTLGYYNGSISRMSWYFLPISTIIYGISYGIKKNSFLNVTIKFMVSVLIAYTYFRIFITDSSLVPYTFFWE